MVDVRDCGEYNSVAWETPESRQRAVKMYKWLQNNCNTSNLRSRLAHSSGVFLAGDWVRVWLNAVFPQKKRGQTFFPALSIYEHRKIAFIAMKKQSRYLDFLLLQIKRFVIIRNYFNPFFIFEKEAVVRVLWKKKNLTMKNEIRTRQNTKMHLRFSGEIVPKFDIYLVEVLTWLQPRSYGLGMGTRLAQGARWERVSSLFYRRPLPDPQLENLSRGY